MTNQVPPFGDQAQKLKLARTALIAPFRDEREQTHAFGASLGWCSAVLKDFNPDEVDDGMKDHVHFIQKCLGISIAAPNTFEGQMYEKAKAMSYAERKAFANAVNDLAYYFDDVHNDKW